MNKILFLLIFILMSTLIAVSQSYEEIMEWSPCKLVSDSQLTVVGEAKFIYGGGYSEYRFFKISISPDGCLYNNYSVNCDEDIIIIVPHLSWGLVGSPAKITHGKKHLFFLKKARSDFINSILEESSDDVRLNKELTLYNNNKRVYEVLYDWRGVIALDERCLKEKSNFRIKEKYGIVDYDEIMNSFVLIYSFLNSKDVDLEDVMSSDNALFVDYVKGYMDSINSVKN